MDLDGEVKFQDLAQEFSRRNRLTTKPVKIPVGEAPVHQIVLTGLANVAFRSAGLSQG